MELKKVVLVGASTKKNSLFSYILKKLLNLKIEIVGIFDNDDKKWGMNIQNIVVGNVEDGIKQNEDAFIIICTIKEYKSLTIQMERLGKVKGQHFEYAFRIDQLFNPNEYAYYKNINKKGELDYPNSIRIELSSYCNLKCIYCRYHSKLLNELPNGCNHNMSFELFKEVVDQINRIGTINKVLNVEKGEMFCNPNWYEMIQYLADNTEIKQFHFSTNGMLLSKENVDKLLKLNFDSISITISLDGYSIEENELLRHGSDFSIIEENVRNLLKKKTDKIVVQIQNTQFLTQEDMSVYKKNIQLSSSESYLKEIFGMDLTVERFATLVTNYDEIDNKICQKYNVHSENVELVHSEGCPLPLKELTIDSEGYICVCGCEPQGQLERIGHISENDILKVWNNKIMKKIRSCYKNGEVVPMCKNCISNAMETCAKVFVKN